MPVMLALWPGSAIRWPQKLRLMLMMLVCDRVSDTYLPQKGTADSHDAGLEFAESHLLVAASAADARDAGLKAGKCHPLATETADDAHDAGLESAIFWSQEVLLMLVMLASRPGNAIHWPRELRLMLTFSR